MVFRFLSYTHYSLFSFLLDIMTIGEMAQHYRTDIHFYGMMIGENDNVWDIPIPGCDTEDQQSTESTRSRTLTFRLTLHSALLNKDVTYQGVDTLASLSDWLLQTKLQITNCINDLETTGQREQAERQLLERRRLLKAAQEHSLDSWTEL